MDNHNQVNKLLVLNGCIKIITDYSTLVENVLLKIKLATIKVIEIE